MIYSKEKNRITSVATSSTVTRWHFTHANSCSLQIEFYTTRTHAVIHPPLNCNIGTLGVKEKTQVQTEWARLDGHMHSLSLLHYL